MHISISDLEAQQVVIFLSYSPLFSTYLINYRPVWFSIFLASPHFYGAARSCCHGDTKACVGRACLPWTKASPPQAKARLLPSRPRLQSTKNPPLPLWTRLPASVSEPPTTLRDPHLLVPIPHLVPPTARLQPIGACPLFSNSHPNH